MHSFTATDWRNLKQFHVWGTFPFIISSIKSKFFPIFGEWISAVEYLTAVPESLQFHLASIWGFIWGIWKHINEIHCNILYKNNKMCNDTLSLIYRWRNVPKINSWNLEQKVALSFMVWYFNLKHCYFDCPATHLNMKVTYKIKRI